MPTLDVDFAQVCIDFPRDAGGFFWHHRLLVCPLGGSGWTGVTPDHSCERIDLSRHRVIVLRRNAPFPAARVHEIYAFDPDAWTQRVHDRCIRECRDLAAVHGAAPAAAVASDEVWRVSDVSHVSFAQLVPAAVLSDTNLFVERDSASLVRLDNTWVSAAKVPSSESVDDFKLRYHAGPGRDGRLLGDHRDADGRRFLALTAVMSLLLETAWPHWPISGPRSVKEFLLALRSAGHTALIDYHNSWVKSSGTAEKAAHTREHRFILEVLRLLLQYDQLECSSLAGAELLLRRLYQIELAVRKSPKAPDYDGLEFLLETAVDTSGAAVLPSIAKWLGETQHKEAFTLKQMRLWTEERAANDKKRDKKEKP